MKKLLLLLPLLALPAFAQNATFTLAWDPGLYSTRFEVRLTSGTNTFTALTTNFTYTFTNLTYGTSYTVNVTGISVDGIYGQPSTNKVVPLPGQPNNLRVSMLFEAAPFPTGPWTSESNIVLYITATDPNRFFRGRMEIQKLR